jgi:tRNA(fMet)-specific endonuclease VapC
LSTTSELQSAIVDTDVVSLIFKRDTRASLYRPHLDGRALTVSFITVAELQRWALVRQ